MCLHGSCMHTRVYLSLLPVLSPIYSEQKAQQENKKNQLYPFTAVPHLITPRRLLLHHRTTD